MRNQSVRKGAHAEGTMWYVPNYANVVVKATNGLRTIRQVEPVTLILLIHACSIVLHLQN